MAETKSSAPAAKPAAGKSEPDWASAPYSLVPEEYRGDVERLAKLDREAAELRDKLSEAGVVVPNVPHKPSFGMSEGTREELERVGKATDPFTGEKLTRDDLKR